MIDTSHRLRDLSVPMVAVVIDFMKDLQKVKISTVTGSEMVCYLDETLTNGIRSALAQGATKIIFVLDEYPEGGAPLKYEEQAARGKRAGRKGNKLVDPKPVSR